uniref:Uncharacterized protein n=1 Tax=Chondria tumulosa TaxID=2740715 RepID=A0A896SVE7_9FLOR|nr:hypothetical protein K8K75_pgp118 [Chondria tumulosa]QSD57089.1 hypothetical protein [Chondria tumulosa]
MTTNNNLVNRYLKGSWFSQTNIYILNTKQKKILTKQLCVTFNKVKNTHKISNTNHNKITSNFNLNTSNLECKIAKISIMENKINAIIEMLNKNLFKFKSYINNNNLIYEEYLYIINNNLMFSTGTLKRLNDSKYLGITVNSYIKLKT